MPTSHRHELRVRYGECDAQGAVFNAHYLAYFDVGMTEHWRAALGSYRAMVDTGVDAMVVEATVRYRTPARFDDVVSVHSEVARLGRTSLIMRYRLTRVDAGAEALLADGEVAYVFVDTEGHRKTPIPDWIRAALAPDRGVAARG